MSLQIFEYKNSVRATGDGRFSVYDVLVAFEVTKTPKRAQEVLKRIQDKHPEVSASCGNFKFPGRGQRETPVATEEGIYQILMLCPGERGAEFRKWAAGILADPEKAVNHGIAKWKKQGKSDNWIAARIDGKLKRHTLTDTLKEHGVSQPMEYAVCTNQIYEPLLGGTAQEIREERGIAKRKPLRDGMSQVELAAVALAEALASEQMESEQSHGFNQCRRVCHNAGNKVRRVFD